MSNDTTISDENQEENLSGEDEAIDVRGEDGDPDQASHPGQRGRKSHTFQLHPEHMQCSRRAQRLQSDPSTYYIPVTIGPVLS
jgi:hypothetical protein